MKNQQFHLITGASGSGKSTLIAELNDRGFSTFPEAGTAILREQLESIDAIFASVDRKGFMEAVLTRSIRDYQEAQALARPVFFDRGIPEWSKYLDHGPERFNSITKQYPYGNKVFVVEPWPEIYVCNHERIHSFEQAAKSYVTTIAAYTEAGYEICIIPKSSVQERAAFILAQVNTNA